MATILLSCEKECQRDANIGVWDNYLDFRYSPLGQSTYELHNGYNRDILQLKCELREDRLTKIEADDCGITELVRPIILSRLDGEESMQFEYQCFSGPANMVLRAQGLAFAWFYSDEYETGIEEYRFFYDSVNINGYTYYDVIGSISSTLDDPGGRVNQAYINQNQGVVAFRDTNMVWWNLVVK